VAVAVELPSAMIELGFSTTETFAAGPTVCFKTVRDNSAPSIAVIVAD
jgi:hypothetical protein